jgi:peptide/nickel transport system permease protein
MLKLLLQRGAAIVAAVFAASVVLFAVLASLPGKASAAALGLNPTPAAVAAFDHRYGLDRPLPAQYLSWMGGILHGNFGTSLQTNVPIGTELAQRIPVTLELTVLASIVAFGLAIPMAFASFLRRGRADDVAITSLGLLGLSIPPFVSGTVLVLVVSLHFHLLPPGGFVPLSQSVTGNLTSMVLPALSLGLASSGILMRIFRVSLGEAFERDFALMSRARGASTWWVIRHHAARLAFIPLTTVGAMEISAIFGGSVVIEQIFQLPGVGSMILDGITNRDFRVLQAAALTITVFVMVANFGVDVLAAAIDPRLRARTAAA